MNAARKAVEHGYRVFILPNPKGTRTPGFIFEQKGNSKVYDLKTILGKASVSNRLFESIGQSNRVLLNMTVDYNARLLASEIHRVNDQVDGIIKIVKNEGMYRLLIQAMLSKKPVPPC